MSHLDEDNADDLLANMIVLGLSLIVMAAVVIGVVAGMDHNIALVVKPEKTTPDATCIQTGYKESCMASLQPVGNYDEVITYLRNGTCAGMESSLLNLRALFA